MLVSRSCCIKSPPTWQLRIRDVFSLSTGGQKSKIRIAGPDQGVGKAAEPCRSSRENPLSASSSFSCCCCCPWLTIAWLPSSRLASLNLPRLHLHITSSVCVSNPPPDRSCEVTVMAFKAHLHNLPSQDPYLNHICQDFFSIRGEGTFTSSGGSGPGYLGGALTCLPQCPLGS